MRAAQRVRSRCFRQYFPTKKAKRMRNHRLHTMMNRMKQVTPPLLTCSRTNSFTHFLPFSAGAKYKLPSVRINLNEEDDEDVRTERFRGKLIQEELNKLRQVYETTNSSQLTFVLTCLFSHMIEIRKYLI